MSENDKLTNRVIKVESKIRFYTYIIGFLLAFTIGLVVFVFIAAGQRDEAIEERDEARGLIAPPEPITQIWDDIEAHWNDIAATLDNADLEVSEPESEPYKEMRLLGEALSQWDAFRVDQQSSSHDSYFYQYSDDIREHLAAASSLAERAMPSADVREMTARFILATETLNRLVPPVTG